MRHVVEHERRRGCKCTHCARATNVHVGCWNVRPRVVAHSRQLRFQLCCVRLQLKQLVIGITMMATERLLVAP